MKKIIVHSFILLIFFINNALAEEKKPIDNIKTYQSLTLYDDQLSQLYSTLGALHSLSNICFGTNQQWRNFAQSLNNSENLNSLRRITLFAAFNTSYRTFTTTYNNCTPAAKEIYAIYKNQGKDIANNLLQKLAYSEK